MFMSRGCQLALLCPHRRGRGRGLDRSGRLGDHAATAIRGERRDRPSGRGRVADWLAAGAAAALVAGALPAIASAEDQSFTTSGEHAFVVPVAVTSVRVTLVGGNGGRGVSSGGGPYADGGAGATATAVLGVTPGETLYAEVAGDGRINDGNGGFGLPGYGGGGVGGAVVFIASAPGGGGGGGASDVRTCPVAAPPATCATLDSRLVVAGGGGGGGGIGRDTTSSESIFGGIGGAADAHGFNGETVPGHWSDTGGLGGSAGTLSAGGPAGGNSGGSAATDGKPGVGGDGGTSVGGGGGGGGGGLYGGGGGGAGSGELDLMTPTVRNGGGGGGGGGASGVPGGATGVSGFSLVPTAFGAQPSITITWTPPTPTVAASPAVTSSPTVAPLARPVVSGLRLSRTRLRLGKHPARLAKRVPVETTISFRLSIDATIRLTFARATSGRRAGRRCVPITPTNRRRRACRVYRRVPGAVTLAAPAGANRIRFQGVLDGGKRLRPGSYRLSLAASNTAGPAPRAQHAVFTLDR